MIWPRNYLLGRIVLDILCVHKYLIKVCYFSKTYKEALVKLKRLTKTDNVLSLKSEDSASEAQAQLTLAVKRQKLRAEASELLTSLMDDQQDNQLEKNSPNLKNQEDLLPVARTTQTYKKSSPTKYKKKGSRKSASVESSATSTVEEPGNASEQVASGDGSDQAAATGHESDQAATAGHGSASTATAGHGSGSTAPPGKENTE
ncbi:uncharacterized protein LOC103316022 [Nasonia vitripennis]|uniref:Uncharacterized protein n=1 Tax=Nasonia vitripennis TaxID=7425 RepID=A0A7M7PYX3_NASVI|nr:uncharacterized protein LOC103316022 [Nasonia vitripennis]